MSAKSKKTSRRRHPVQNTSMDKEKLLLLERMASFPQSNPNPIFEIDFSGKITFYNRAAKAALERLKAGKNIRAYFPPDLKKIINKTHQGEKVQLIRRVRVKDAIFEESIHIVPGYKTLRFYLKDITDREKTGMSLRESEERYKKLFQGLPVSTVVFQKVGKDFITREYNRMSNAFTDDRMPGYVGRSAKALYRSQPEILKKFADVWKEKKTQSLQSSYRMRSTGRLLYLNLTLVYVPPDRIMVHSRDITERRLAEEALRETKENLEIRVKERTMDLERTRTAVETERQRLYGVLEMLPVYVVLLTTDYRVSFANRFFRKRFGESRGRRCYEYLFKRIKPCAVCETYKVLKTGSPHRWEWTGPDGRNYDIYDFPYKDADGSPLIMEMGIDITEQKRAQSALKLANAYHRSLIEVSLDPLVTISADGKITDVNEATIKATGISRSDLIGTDFSSYFTEPQKAREGYQQVFARGFVADYPLTIRHQDGHLTDVLYNASIYKDTRGHVLGVFAAARDITVLKKAEAELRDHRDHLEELVNERTKDLHESEKRLHRSQEMAQLGSWELDLVNNRLSWSDEVYRIFGLKPQEFGATYEAFLEHVHPDDRSAVDTAYSASLREGRDTYEIEHRVVRKDTGEIRIVHERCEHIRDATGKIIRSIGMVQDITLQKQAENEMRALNLKLEEINQHLNDFVFTVSHDLKAPLRAIQGYADALLEDYAGKIDPPGKANIERIVTATQRLDNMIQDLLAYSRLTSEQINLEPVDLNKLVAKVMDRLAVEIASKSASLTIDPSLPAVRAYHPILQQVLDNLVLNAVTYVESGVKPAIKIWVEEHGGLVYLYIKDNGIGIAPENQERIFKVFERLHGVESYPGTGVGLAIVKKGIERMGGKVGINSALGKGSTFWIALPKHKADKDRG
jgi:PAS domain S-box-containing protein